MQMNIFPLCTDRRYSTHYFFENFIHSTEFAVKFQVRKLLVIYY